MKILVAVMSCLKHSHLWESITSKNIDDLIIFTGGSDDTFFDKNKKVLHLKCDDGYEGLPEKMILMMEYILYSIHFEDVTHIIKIDDHDNRFTEDNIKNLYNLEELKKYHYVGQKLNNYTIYPWQWYEGNKWHIGKVSETCFWYNKYYTGGYVPWLDGGCSYILSADAMKCITSWYNSSNINELRVKEIFEDAMMGKILYHHNIFPKEVNYGIIGDK
jgi:hypothetical protein